MKSPLKSKPLNNPGESLEYRRNDIALERVFLPLIVAILMFVWAAFEWYRWLHVIPPNPYITTVLALGVIMWAAVRMTRAFKEIKLINQGILSEKAVGQFLERLRADGAEVFHDIQGESFNLDHVVIHRTGVYVVETKSLKKPESGKTELFFNGKEVLKEGKPLPRNPVVQVSAASVWLRQLIEESSGRRVSVKGIVTFPGWYIRSNHNTPKNLVWVLNPKAIPSFISKQSEILAVEDVNLLKFHLGKYIRASKLF
ncbi:nuclease-related domain-containing protein [Aliidiomarina haloalkalitolerans]|uniref:Nuclease n=1 Tax=Aliidiomarina haloalkalitolerans TaxID=859059 RepID=A0A432VUG1_9GAMM|nr:nuclease-related domain-containing protein [Aliidiomarina haloalkalitolerans]RUO20160.1 nuclease [Aliidiomarina haloalkalitolerans]